MKLFFRYWKQNGKSLAVGLVFWLIFLAAFALYHLPMAAVLYPSAVCAVLGAAFTAWDYGRVREKHKVLRRIQENVDLPAVLPPDGTIDGQDYQAIIRLQQQAREKLEEETSLRYSELVDYYTLWTHQIKTPIAAMRLTLQKEDSASSRRLSAELFRVEQYVEMALVFLKLDEAASDYVIREHDLDAILKQSIRKFSGEFISRKIKLCYEPLPLSVITDEKWLCFVVDQLLSNALKYTPEGSITIRLEKPETLVIEDTGIGIAPEDLPRVFEKGYTGYNGRRDKKASGIGLYLCRRICRQLGHEISIASRPDHGTAVRVNLAQKRRRFE